VVGVQATPAGIKVKTMEMKALDEDGLLALRWADVDLKTGECLVVRSLQETSEGVGFKAPKAARGRRVVLLPRLAISALKADRTNQDQERLRLGQGYAEQDLVLARANGTPNRLVSERLGHSQTSTTMNVYAHAPRGRT
jgi:integrase